MQAWLWLDLVLCAACVLMIVLIKCVLFYLILFLFLRGLLVNLCMPWLPLSELTDCILCALLIAFFFCLFVCLLDDIYILVCFAVKEILLIQLGFDSTITRLGEFNWMWWWTAEKFWREDCHKMILPSKTNCRANQTGKQGVAKITGVCCCPPFLSSSFPSLSLSFFRFTLPVLKVVKRYSCRWESSVGDAESEKQCAAITGA